MALITNVNFRRNQPCCKIFRSVSLDQSWMYFREPESTLNLDFKRKDIIKLVILSLLD